MCDNASKIAIYLGSWCRHTKKLKSVAPERYVIGPSFLWLRDPGGRAKLPAHRQILILSIVGESRNSHEC
jgi:hypothetical protein